jgi:hypothetical protein
MTYMTQKVLSQEIAKIGKFVRFHIIIRQNMKNGISLAHIPLSPTLSESHSGIVI